MARTLIEQFNGVVPSEIEDLQNYREWAEKQPTS